MIRVVAVDDQSIVREGLVLLLNAQPDMEVVGTADNGESAIELVRELEPDVVVMDVRMPRLDGVAATRAIVAERDSGPEPRPDAPVGAVSPQRSTRVLILSSYREDDVVYGSLRAGASGFLHKDAPIDRLLQAVRALGDGDSWIDPSVAGRVLDALRTASAADVAGDALTGLLTPRERQVLAMMAQGFSNSEISAEWFVSEATVKTHVSRILLKTGSRDRSSAVVFAYRHGLVSFPASS